MTDDITLSERRYITLEAARALECNGCGDCCDSRRSPDGTWAWAGVPEDLYAGLVGEALIIPLEQVGQSWHDREHRPEDSLELIPTYFRCTAFRPEEDGRGLCGRHTEARPAVCGEFPVWGTNVEEDLEAYGETNLGTDFLPRCTWFNLRVVRDDDPRVEVIEATSAG
jgi:Fe-S-cluster containining protein